VTVVLAAHGYPEAPRTGDVISGVAAADMLAGVHVTHAGTRLDGESLVTSGGRVLAVTGTGSSLADARAAAYAGVGRISFDGAQYRTDIAAEAAAG
jgi:phosphoribosylamine--glycine ligase